jgi:hypothetical protein
MAGIGLTPRRSMTAKISAASSTGRGTRAALRRTADERIGDPPLDRMMLASSMLLLRAKLG